MKSKVFIVVTVLILSFNLLGISFAQAENRINYTDLSFEIIKSYKSLDFLLKNTFNNHDFCISSPNPSYKKLYSIINEIDSKTNTLTSGIKYSFITEAELNYIISLFCNNINCYSTMEPTYEVLKFRLLNNNFNKNTILSIKNFLYLYEEKYYNKNVGCAIAAMAGVTIVVGGTLATGAMHSHNTNQQVHPNIQHPNGSITMVPYGNNGEPIHNDDGISVTMVPYGQ